MNQVPGREGEKKKGKKFKILYMFIMKASKEDIYQATRFLKLQYYVCGYREPSNTFQKAREIPPPIPFLEMLEKELGC